VKRRYNQLEEDIKAIEAGRVPLPSYGAASKADSDPASSRAEVCPARATKPEASPTHLHPEHQWERS
jgi:hypothetical protein